MKKIILLSFIFFNVHLSFSQIKFQKSLSDAVKQASSTKKSICIHITIPVYAKGTKSIMDQVSVSSFYNKNFINYKVEMMDSVGRELINKYGVTVFPASVFIDYKQNLILKTSTGNNAENALNNGKTALIRKNSGIMLSTHEEKYANEKHNAKLIKNYINLRMEAGIFDNAKLIDEYVDYKTIGELNDPNEIILILRSGAYAFGKAFNINGLNKTKTDSVFMTLPLQERIDINDRIINNTQNEAIRTKNIAMAPAAMNFTRNTWSHNYNEGSKQSQLKILNYYKAVKDTANYYPQTSYFVDQYYMRVNADSIRFQDPSILGKMQSKVPTFNQPSPSNANIPDLLNNAAWDFYVLGTRNKLYLSKAFLWVKRAIDLKQNFQYYDTLAQIFYRMEFYDEALINQNKAIDMAIEVGTSLSLIESLKSTGQKIKERKL
ncbi:hypothetical protein [Pedobacter sp. B4-66]|uniref:hypothetical protein n=1 Tax=Pedobacter sp. B4-66 TaxID=2817280 RepID=UPI001BDA237B|nr:hypothetical protein [Pedobacter sp. B4-66]